MSKKSKITSILVNAVNVPAFVAVHYGVGDVPKNVAGEDAGENIVKTIKHARKCFGQGAVVDVPCYVIEFADVEEKAIIPTNAVTRWTVDAEEIETVPALPEA